MQLCSPLASLPRCLLLCLLTTTTASPVRSDQPVDFNAEVRPLLTKHCTSCHGGVKAAGDVSFINAADVLPPDGWIIEPGDPDNSILIERVESDDPDERMPPPDEHPEPLSAKEISILRRWIAQGARWESIWSVAPLRDSLTDANAIPAAEAWAKVPLDKLVFAKLAQREQPPSSEAPAQQWLRRVAFDLTGLPPTVDQLLAFEKQLTGVTSAGQRERVYERQVDHYLASESFGERWAAVWMDLARYADSQGYEKDPHRDMWPYRDWLISAFNRDMPYDEFTIKQLAGDLLPNPTADDIIATAFHRNTQTNTEGGTDDEEFRIAALIDRVNTTWTVWQATTMGCVQCHSHPYDPIDHDEYYASLALFNSTLDWDLSDDFPFLKIPTDPAAWQDAVSIYHDYVTALQQRNQTGQVLFDDDHWQTLHPDSIQSTGGQLVIDGKQIRSDGGTFPAGVKYTASYQTSTEPSQAITALKIDILPLDEDPKSWPEQGAVITQIKLWVEDGANEEQADKPKPYRTEVKVADVFTDAITMPNDPRDVLGNNARGIGSFPKLDRPRHSVLVLASALTLSPTQKLVIEMTHDAKASGGGATPVQRLRVCATDTTLASELTQQEVYAQAESDWKHARERWNQLKGAKLPIMQARPASMQRPTYQFIRGNWMDRGEPISPAIPSMFDSPAQATPIDNRLDFARWLVSDQNPTAARVWANRIWEQLFGVGLVETLEDFGSSGQQPADSQLLDHLAVSLRDRHAWRLKPFLKEIVLSSTYRQDHQASAELIEQDPRNRFLARGPRTRLSAEMIRDQALAVSGLLHDQIGGPSVMPPQPDGVWQAVYSGMKWNTAEGDQRYRRGLYTYWRRTSPYPSFMMFDAPTRDLCSARRIATNTPLQALVTLNDPVYVQCSAQLADRAVRETNADATIDAPIAWMIRAVTQQIPESSDVQDLAALYRDLETPSQTAVIDPAALRIVAMTILNWDKALTK